MIAALIVAAFVVGMACGWAHRERFDGYARSDVREVGNL